MNILVIGSIVNLEECKLKFGNRHSYRQEELHQNAEKFFPDTDVIFDYVIGDSVKEMEVYRDHPKAVAFLNTTLISLNELVAAVPQPIFSMLIGFCGLPGFVNRPVLEMSLRPSHDRKKAESLCNELSTEFTIVDDRVGLVTPRVICMIINEAYFTVQEGTASRADIDLGMKLGTNYPFGPFEWAEKIGVQNVFKVLQALYHDTKDERYKICSLLKKEALQSAIAPR